MNDYSHLLDKKNHLENIKTMEEASAFCKAYGYALEKHAKDSEIEMLESGGYKKAKIALCVLPFIFVGFCIIEWFEETPSFLVGFIVVITAIVIVVSINTLTYVKKCMKIAERFQSLSILEGITNDRAIHLTNNLINRYNRMVDDDLPLSLVYNPSFYKHPERFGNIVLFFIGICLVLIVVFLVIN